MNEWGFLIALISGAAGVGGALGAQWLQLRGEDARRRAEEDRRSWEARRDAYLELLRSVDRIRSLASGALAGGSAVDADSAHALVVAEAQAEFHASPETWQRMKPCVAAVSAMANFTSLASRGTRDSRRAREAQELIEELGAKSPEGWEQLRSQLLDAARDDLSL